MAQEMPKKFLKQLFIASGVDFDLLSQVFSLYEEDGSGIRTQVGSAIAAMPRYQ
jgi:hypothetical protein